MLERLADGDVLAIRVNDRSVVAHIGDAGPAGGKECRAGRRGFQCAAVEIENTGAGALTRDNRRDRQGAAVQVERVADPRASPVVVQVDHTGAHPSLITTPRRNRAAVQGDRARALTGAGLIRSRAELDIGVGVQIQRAAVVSQTAAGRVPFVHDHPALGRRGNVDSGPGGDVHLAKTATSKGDEQIAFGIQDAAAVHVQRARARDARILAVVDNRFCATINRAADIQG